MNQRSPHIPGRLFWIIWTSLLFAAASYLLILQFFPAPPTGEQTSLDKTRVRTFAFIACGNLLAGFAVWLLRVSKLAGEPSPAAHHNTLFTACLLSWGLVKTVAVYGLVLGLQGYPIDDYGGFLLSGFSALIFMMPRFASMDENF